MKKTQLLILVLLLSSILFAGSISSSGYTLEWGEDFSSPRLVHGSDIWPLTGEAQSVNGVRLRGAARLKSQSLISLSVQEEETGRRLTLNSANADKTEVEELDSSVRVTYSFEDGIVVTLEFGLTERGLFLALDNNSGLLETGELFVESYQLLPFFSSSTLRDSGYFLIPDGEGALLTFNSGRSGLYSEKVYGRDPAIGSTLVNTANREYIRLPLFGVEKNGASVIVTALGGEAMATLQASAASSANPYNTACFSFLMRASQELKISEDAFKVEYEKARAYDGVTQLLITAVDGDGYTAMAKTFASLFLKDNHRDYQAVVRLEGLEKEKLTVLGVPLPISSFKGNKTYADALESLSSLSVPSLLEITSWNGKEMLHKTSSSYRPSGKLGKEKALTLDLGDGITFDFDPLSAAKSSKNTVKEISGKPVRVYEYAPNSSYRVKESLRYLTKADEAISFKDSVKGERTPAFRTLSELVWSDYSENGASRQSFVDEMRSYLAKEGEYALYGGDFFALEGAFHVYDAPFTASGFNMLTLNVPFYEIALSGKLTYSSLPLSEAADKELYLLKCLETGMLPVLEAGTSLPSSFDVLRECAGKEIVTHEILPDGRRAVRYENGAVFTIDYSTKSYERGEVEL